jgi:integrase
MDDRKRPIRGLWRRNGKFIARIKVETDTGQPVNKWVALEALTVGAAKDELSSLKVERNEKRLRPLGRSPKFSDYMTETYWSRLAGSGKKPRTIRTERAHLNRWVKAIGQLPLDKIRTHHVTSALHQLKEDGLSNRTRNVSLVCLRGVLKEARLDGHLKTLPVEGIPWQRVDSKPRALMTSQEIDLFCRASMVATKNGQEFADYVRLMAYCGAREQEAIKIQWADVDFERGLLTVGSDADTKNREGRHVDFNPSLEALLKEMHERRAPDSRWLFPSPQRGERDEHAKTFRESRQLTRDLAGAVCLECCKLSFGAGVEKCGHCGGTRLERREHVLPDKLRKFGFHDCRHHFISYSVMAGIDFMTIARWVGHKDGGILD